MKSAVSHSTIVRHTEHTFSFFQPRTADLFKHHQRKVKNMIRTKHLRRGDWRTVESFWNATGTAFFRAPAGAKIKVRYGVGFLGFNSQEQTLNGSDYKKLEVGTGSVAYARIQVRVSQDTDITYDVYGGGVAVTTPEIPF